MRSAANTKLPFSTETTSVSAGSLLASSVAMTSTRRAISSAEKRIETVGRSGMRGSLFDDRHDVGRAFRRIVERPGEEEPPARGDRAFDQGIDPLAQHVLALAEHQSETRGRAFLATPIHELAAHHIAAVDQFHLARGHVDLELWLIGDRRQ